jgi:hypothetical protein
VQLDYIPAEGKMLYAGVSRGVKSAGFNTNISGFLTNDRTRFKSEFVTSYEVGDYAAYERLMQHWRSVLGEALYEIDYADLVKQPAAIGSAVAQSCRLRWNPAAVQIQRNTAASHTASAAQVRRPIYESSVDRWRHYRHHLGPLARNCPKAQCLCPTLLTESAAATDLCGRRREALSPFA